MVLEKNQVTFYTSGRVCSIAYWDLEERESDGCQETWVSFYDLPSSPVRALAFYCGSRPHDPSDVIPAITEYTVDGKVFATHNLQNGKPIEGST